VRNLVCRHRSQHNVAPRPRHGCWDAAATEDFISDPCMAVSTLYIITNHAHLRNDLLAVNVVLVGRPVPLGDDDDQSSRSRRPRWMPVTVSRRS
jgi:hypothetical protein